jgi:hypothetical protein
MTVNVLSSTLAPSPPRPYHPEIRLPIHIIRILTVVIFLPFYILLSTARYSLTIAYIISNTAFTLLAYLGLV